jgi:hypothetical protein
MGYDGVSVKHNDYVLLHAHTALMNDKVHHSTQYLPFPTQQTACVPARGGLSLNPTHTIRQNKHISTPSHSVGILSMTMIHSLDSQLQQSISACGLPSPTVPVNEHIIETPDKSIHSRQPK